MDAAVGSFSLNKSSAGPSNLVKPDLSKVATITLSNALTVACLGKSFNNATSPK